MSVDEAVQEKASIHDMHVYHNALEGYREDAILFDGCPVCEARADAGLEGLLLLDPPQINTLWNRMLNVHYGGKRRRPEDGQYRSIAEARLGRQLYLLGIIFERTGEGEWNPDRFIS